ncbi:NAD(+)--rifampin ADP-ribosyltransferase [Mycolicibacterium alvei]|uniref:NAD(+)--rifampin ADP-ribosyltransferase n=2 Tax=Mycolicibacterium alvei TaxID=67081 RepID=A0A6N4UYE8_9MYCO|nr:NAD(+)--rifampin ADP-ribosyltransferase [Mycolicibacterium alvei]MCV7000099.1 NAD(+)--rifampin ADP-ribosyltransferase [Mycolicibacterium alvei]BBX30096.1 NAD(+)--rifampin ADP-ribosyltransferase [Mycolicibacterium alvei]
MSDMTERFVVHESGAYLHGTKADLREGDLLVPGCPSNYEAGRVSNHVYVTRALDAAVLAAELALGEGPGRVYMVEPLGAVEDDPNVTDKKFPGNPTHSYRSREPVKVVGEITDWIGHPPEYLQAFREGLAELRRKGLAVMYD